MMIGSLKRQRGRAKEVGNNNNTTSENRKRKMESKENSVVKENTRNGDAGKRIKYLYKRKVRANIPQHP
jgi:hypothetical protein